MRKTVSSILSSLLIAAPAATVAQTNCADRDRVVDRLSSGYGEAFAGGGLQNSSRIFEIWISEEQGTWTILLTRADGISCVMASGTNWRDELLATLTNPNVALILMMIGIYGLIFEFSNPGIVVPGVIGTISLLLALYAFQVLPINYAGVALILVGLGLMLGEAFVPSFGALGLGGIAAFVVGAVLLMDTEAPGFQLSWLVIVPFAIVSAGLFMVVFAMLLRSHRRAVVSGPEQMVGSVGDVIDWSGQQGQVRVHGEIWSARAGRPIRPGQAVRVAGRDGLVLIVEPAERE